MPTRFRQQSTTTQRFCFEVFRCAHLWTLVESSQHRVSKCWIIEVLAVAEYVASNTRGFTPLSMIFRRTLDSLHTTSVREIPISRKFLESWLSIARYPLSQAGKRHCVPRRRLPSAWRVDILDCTPNSQRIGCDTVTFSSTSATRPPDDARHVTRVTNRGRKCSGPNPSMKFWSMRETIMFPLSFTTTT